LGGNALVYSSDYYANDGKLYQYLQRMYVTAIEVIQLLSLINHPGNIREELIPMENIGEKTVRQLKECSKTIDYAS